MTSEYEQRRTAQAKRDLDQDQAERQKEVIIGEISGKVEKDISKGHELKVKIQEVNDLSLKPSMDYVRGNTVIITIKADPALSEEHKMSWGRVKPSHPDEASGIVKGKIKANQDLKVRIENIDVQKVISSVELDKGDSIRIIIKKA